MAGTGGGVGEELLQLKRRLEEESSRRAELQGELNSLMHQLEQDFGVASLEEAQELIQEEQRKTEELEQAIQDVVQEIKGLMPK